jgi:hypothetical protein
MFDLPILARSQPLTDACPSFLGDVVTQDIVYLTCIRAEDGEGIDFLELNTFSMYTMPI